MVRVVAGRTGSTLLALDQIDGRRHPGRLVAGSAEDDGVAQAEGQLGGGGAAIEGQGVHPLAVEDETDGPGGQFAEGADGRACGAPRRTRP